MSDKLSRAVRIFLQDPLLYLLYPIAWLLGYKDSPLFHWSDRWMYDGDEDDLW